METEISLAKSEPRSHGAIVLKESLREADEQRALLSEYINKHMTENTDYGKIPGTDKPTLFKPGAEKLTDLFRCTPKFALLTREEDFDKGFFNYMFRVRLYSRDADAVLAEGFGSANSREGRYRWRIANRKCPTCGKEAIIAGKPEYGGGWLCFKKKGGCGAKFDQMASEITSQAQGQVENDDIATLANTILKMAKKRALVDGAIALARCSDLFTQDVEDLEPVAHDISPSPPPERGRAIVRSHDCATEGHIWSLKGFCEMCGAPEGASKPKPVEPGSPKQSPDLRRRCQVIWKKVQSHGMELEAFQKWTTSVLGRKSSSAEWTHDEVSHLENALAELAAHREPGGDK